MEKWQEILNVKTNNDEIHAMTVTELKNEGRKIMDAQKALLDHCDHEQRELKQSEVDAFDRSQKRLEKIDHVLERKPVRQPPPMHGTYRTDDGHKPVRWDFGKVGVSYRQLHYGDENHSLPEDEDIEDFLRGVVEGKIPRGETRSFSPEYYTAQLLNKADANSIYLPRVRQFPMEGKWLHIGLWDSQNQSNGYFGNVEVEWKPEEGEFTPADPATREVNLIAKKAGLFVDANRELVEDAEAIAPVISPKLAFALGQTVDECVLSGSGIGRPVGIIHSDATISVGRQTAGLIEYLDIINIFSRVHPAFIANSVWVASPETIPQLLGMKDGAGSYIWIPSAATGAASAASTTSLDRPIFWSDKLPGLAETGTLLLADLSMYAYATRKGIILESSNSPGWYRDKISFRGIIRCDGTPLLSGPIIPRRGAVTLSAFAMLNE